MKGTVIQRYQPCDSYFAQINFASRLEAQWAALFHLLKWDWVYRPGIHESWWPDFYVNEPCGHSECQGGHDLHLIVQPIECLQDARKYFQEHWHWNSAVLGIHPLVNAGEATHGAGGGLIGPDVMSGENILFHSEIWNLDVLWARAWHLVTDATSCNCHSESHDNPEACPVHD